MKKIILLLTFISGNLFAQISTSLVFFIHEDHDYTYHENGKKKYAHKEVFKKAKKIAEICKNCEVFIYRERPKRIRAPGRAYYYKAGKRIEKIKYQRDSDEKEVYFYKEHSEKARDRKNKITSFFLYFGHHIPEKPEEDYSFSLPDLSFSLAQLTYFFRKWGAGPGGFKFDGILLSTCKNGTPFTVHRLSPFARYIMASPENLHLSYFDLSSFMDVDELTKKKVRKFMKGFAKKSFKRLSKKKTMVTVSLYRTSKTKKFVEEVEENYYQALQETGDDIPSYQDCQDLQEFKGREDIKKGVTSYYKAPKFGSLKRKKTHSGWSFVLSDLEVL